MRALLLLSLNLAFPVFGTITITGAGATFPYPLYSKWFSEYHKQHPDVQINYQSIGSGGGIRQFLDKTIDFGATDVPMTDEQLSKASSPVLHLPMALGAVVATYNLPGTHGDLKISSEVVADIFLGKITRWEDPKILVLNPSLGFKGDIFVVHRSDGSGTTGVFVDYLSKVSSEWKSKVGSGTSVNWPVGLGGKGNEGVTSLVKQTPGSIGYVELIYAETNKLPFFSLKNPAEEFVKPTIKSITSAASDLKNVPEDLRVSITNSMAKGSYPISSLTYLLVYRSMPDPIKSATLVAFLKWSMADGQKLAPDLLYAPLPVDLVARVKAKIATIDTKKAG